MINAFLITTGKLLSYFSRLLNLGNGSTWPGHIALFLNPNFIKQILKKNSLKIILIAGTNGKTTTGKLIQTILEKSGKKVFQNEGGANLLNGIASSLVRHSTVVEKLNYDFAIFEIDENTLPLILREINDPDYIIILNLFRDQLDRYGEVNAIAKKWGKALKKLSRKVTLILNADDPQITSLPLYPLYYIVKAIPIPYRKRSYDQVYYFGLDDGLDDKNLTDNQNQHASDSTYCPKCNSRLTYLKIYYSHLGIWECPKCKFKRPDNVFTKSTFYPLLGIHNQYNINAAVLLAKLNNVSNKTIEQSLRGFEPAFGRQEILNINGRKIQIFLSKNPTSFNESLKTVVNLGGKNVLYVLNDQIPDGRDVSWIWDVDFEKIINLRGSISVAGDRAYDIALRLKYADLSVKPERIYTDLKKAIRENLESLNKKETLYILPTYSAMLEVRKILTGKKIL